MILGRVGLLRPTTPDLGLTTMTDQPMALPQMLETRHWRQEIYHSRRLTCVVRMLEKSSKLNELELIGEFAEGQLQFFPHAGALIGGHMCRHAGPGDDG